MAAALLMAPQSAAAAEPGPSPSPSSSAPAAPVVDPTPSASPSTAPSTSPAPSPAASPSASPKPSKAPRPAGARAAAEPCGGVFVFGSVVHCPEIKDRDKHVFTVRTTVDGERLILQFREEATTGQGLTAWLVAPDGERLCGLGPYPVECAVPVAGTATITVETYSGSGTGEYRLGVDSREHPSSCTTLPNASFSFPVTEREGTLAAGSAGECFRLEQAEGALVRIAESSTGDLRGQLQNAAGEDICYLESYRDCTLTGAGPYRFFLTENYGDAVTFSLSATRLSDPAGCAELPVAGFGDPGADVGSATIEGETLTCLTLTAPAGRHLLAFDNAQNVNWRIADHTGAEVCSKWGEPGPSCPLPGAGTYTLFANGTDSWTAETTFTVAVFPLTGTAGCATTVGTAWNTPPLRVPVTSPLQVDCHRLDAQPGDRVVVRSGGWITDGSGERICDAVREDDQDGCVLPGAGPYRIISAGNWRPDAEDNSYRIEVRRLNDPQGCTTVTAGKYGAAPAGPQTDNPCRVLTVPAAGSYRVGLVDDENYAGYGQVYDPAGRQVCGLGVCTFPAAGSYPLVAGSGGTYATVLLPMTGTGNGCVTVSDLSTAAPARGEFKVAGQYDCLLLPTPTGAGLALLRPQDAAGTGRPIVGVYDATGAYECGGYGLSDSSCVLEGTAPFRAELNLDDDFTSVAGPYALTFARTTGGAACATLPASSFSGTTPVSLTLSGDRYTGCFTLPAGQHSGTEMVAFRRTAGTGRARLSVFGPDGSRRCNTGTSDAEFAVCRLDTGAATVLIEGSKTSGTFDFFRRDLTGTATGCQAITSTVVGTPSVTGTLAGRGDLRCYQVTANAGDRVAIDTRDTANASRTIVLNAAGEQAGCEGYVSGCSVTGHTAYQVLVRSITTSGSTPFQLDVWKVWANGKPPAECTPVPSAAYGFGPYVGTLSSAEPARCVVAPATYFDELTIDVTNPERPDDGFSWDAGLYAVTGSVGMQSCAIGQGGFHCWSGRERLEPTVYLLTNGDRATPHPYRLEATCETPPLCGAEKFTVTSAAPASVVNGGKRIITVTGTALHLRDTVKVTQPGRPALIATVQTVSADRKTLTAEVDLTSAPAGPAGLSVDSFGADTDPVVLGQAFTVTAPPMTATKVPVISGTVAVGQTVKAAVGTWTPAATAYTYRWAANGATISGATGSSYPIAAGVLGKRLTVSVTATRSGYPAGTATSAASAVVAKGKAPAASRKPAITGTAKIGKTVKVSVGTWSPRADSYRYEWRLAGRVIRGATKSTLKLTSSMRDKKLTVIVTTKKAGYADGKATSKAVTVRK